ncbi:DUF7199 family protein [Mycobacterium novum]
MNKVAVWAAALAAGLVMILSLSWMPVADSVPCQHRGWQHIVQHANGNVDADSRYHVLRGERPTCEPGRSSDTDSWEQRRESIDRERHKRSLP